MLKGAKKESDGEAAGFNSPAARMGRTQHAGGAQDKQPGRLPREVGWGMGDRVGVEAEVEVEG